jgi:CubicO group peptidase (beta-lactamase class C family)
MLIGNFIIPTQASVTNEPTSSIDFAGIDQYITAQMDKHGLKGIALAITQADQVLYLKGYGTAGQGHPMTPQTPMYIGSQSKSITGMALAQLIEQGKVNLNDPVIDYIPWFEVADPEATKKITINDLVYHKSGLSEQGYTTIVPDNASLEEGIRSLSTATLTAPIGTKFQYFNMGYCVLMQVIENVSGQKYAEYIQGQIFAPLGMTQSYTDPISARADGLSQGYSRFFWFMVAWPQPHVGYEKGDGYII